MPRVRLRGPRTVLLAGAFEFLAGRRTALLERLPPLLHVSASDPRAATWLAPMLRLLLAEEADPGLAGDVLMSRLADVLLIEALRTHLTHVPCASHPLRALRDPQIGRALQLLHEQPGRPWTVETLARAVGASRSAFAARFSALVGESPLQYLAGWRMVKAAQLLRDTDATLPDIAERVGYVGEASFNRAFKKWEGVPPGTYRRRNRR